MGAGGWRTPPLDTGFRRYGEWGVGGFFDGLIVDGDSPILTFPLRGKGLPAALPLWIPPLSRGQALPSLE